MQGVHQARILVVKVLILSQLSLEAWSRSQELLACPDCCAKTAVGHSIIVHRMQLTRGALRVQGMWSAASTSRATWCRAWQLLAKRRPVRQWTQ